MDKLYKVFEIDTFFGQWGCGGDLVGAESPEDVLSHFPELYPDRKETIERASWMTDAGWKNYLESEGFKEGEVRVYPQFDEEQMEEFRKSLDPDCERPRIREIENMYTDKPYKILYCNGYEE